MPATPKGYWLATVTITDPSAYRGYQEMAPAAFSQYGARFLARGTPEIMEGQAHQRQVIIEFDSMAAARACYHSAEYQAARQKREHACIADVTLLEGL